MEPEYNQENMVAIYENCTVGNITNKNKNKKTINRERNTFREKVLFNSITGANAQGERIGIPFRVMNSNTVLC
jgi:hypothetical protein